MALEKDEDFKNFTFQGTESETIDAGEDLGITLQEDETISSEENVEAEVETPKVETTPAQNQEEDVETEEEQVSFKPLAKLFFEKSGGDFKDEFLQEDSMEGFVELLKDIVKENSTPNFANKEAEDFNEYLAKGGDPKTFFNVYYNSQDMDYESLDLSKMANQKMVLENYYKETTKFSQDKINKLIQSSIANDEIEDDVKEAIETLKVKSEENKKQLIESQKQQQEREAKEYQAQRQQEIRFIESASVKELGFDIPKQEREQLVSFVYGVNQKTGKTAYQEFFEKDPNASIRLAYLAMKNILSEESMIKQTKGKVIKEIESSVNKLAAKTGNSMKPQNNYDKSLAETVNSFKFEKK